MPKKIEVKREILYTMIIQREDNKNLLKCLYFYSWDELEEYIQEEQGYDLQDFVNYPYVLIFKGELKPLDIGCSIQLYIK